MIDKNNNFLTYALITTQRKVKSRAYTQLVVNLYFCVDKQVLKLFSLLAFFTPPLNNCEKKIQLFMK